MSLNAEEQALRTVCNPSFHQCLWLQENNSHGRLRVTFSTTTSFHEEKLPAILFIGPMFGTRYAALQYDKLARECGVRIICTDRPGFGGSTAVPLELRVKVWLETVPALLTLLNVDHVSLVSHSAGTIYTLNTLVHHRVLLNPKTPYVAFLAPFVPLACSNALVPNIAAKLPMAILDTWAGLNTFILSTVSPSMAWSGGIMQSSERLLSLIRKPLATTAQGVTSMTAVDQFGFDTKTAKTIGMLATACQASECNAGANDELKLCLQRCGEEDWSAAIDYRDCVRNIVADSGERPGDEAFRLKIDAFFATSDVMIGAKGQAYFEQCWHDPEISSLVDFTSHTLPETNHDSILMDQRKGALKIAFDTVAAFARSAT